MAPVTRSSAHPDPSDPDHNPDDLISFTMDPQYNDVDMDITTEEAQTEREHDEAGIQTRARSRRSEVVYATASGSGSGSGRTECRGGGPSSGGEKAEGIRVGGPGKENVPPLTIDGHVLYGINVEGDSDEEEERVELPSANSRESLRNSSRSDRHHQMDIDPIQPIASTSTSTPELPHLARVTRTDSQSPSRRGSIRRAKTIAVTSLAAIVSPGHRSNGKGKSTRNNRSTDNEMNVDETEGELEATDREDGETGGQGEEDEEGKRRKRRKTEANAEGFSRLTAQGSSTSTVTVTPTSGGFAVPTGTSGSTPTRSRFSTGGMRTRSGAVVSTRTGRPRASLSAAPSNSSIGGLSSSAASTTSTATTANTRPANRPRTLSQSSSHSSLNGVINGGNGGNAGRLARSISYAYGMQANEGAETPFTTSSGAGASQQRGRLRRSDSTHSSVGYKRKDRENSVCSMMSVRSESVTGGPPSATSVSTSNFTFFASPYPSVSAASGGSASMANPFAAAFGSTSRNVRAVTPDHSTNADEDEDMGTIGKGKSTRRQLFTAEGSSSRKTIASPRKAARKSKVIPDSDDLAPSSPTVNAFPFHDRHSTPPPHRRNDSMDEGINNLSLTPRRARRLQAHKPEREGSATPVKDPGLDGSDDSSPAASQESEQLVTPKIARIVSKLTLEQKMQVSEIGVGDGVSLDDGLGMGRKVTGYKALKAALRCSSADIDANSIVVGREDEKAAIRSYMQHGRLEGEIAAGHERALYVSGPPGTGKTASISSVAREMREVGWNLAFINCMGFAAGKKDDIWNRMLFAWGMDGKGERGLEHGLKTAPETSKHLLVLDEVDALLANTSTVSSNQTLRTLFTLPTLYPTAHIRVIAISNSLDLTARRSIATVLGDLAPDNLTFRAYGSKEMIEIIQSRVQTVHEQLQANGEEKIDVDDKAIELVGRKVEASNGDLRMCLSVMVEAVGATEAEWKKKKCAAASSGDKTPFAKVTLAHVLKALTASLSKLKSNIASSSASVGSSTSNPAVDNKVRSLPPQVRFLLLALLIARTRIALNIRPAHAPAQNNAFASVDYSAERLTSENLNATYQYILSGPKSPFAPVASADFGDLIMQAEVIGLISIGGGNGSGSGAGNGSGSFSSMFGMTPPKASRKKSSNSAGGKGKDRVLDLLVKEDELKHALGIVREGEAVSPGVGGTMENEVRNIWKREEGRWMRVVENRGKSAAGKKKEVEILGFDED